MWCMRTIIRAVGSLCCFIAVCLLGTGIIDLHYLGVAILSSAFWGSVGLLLLFLSRTHKHST
ncbi:hypothetical protein I41_32010 [Lacipirellula limnantheis]|uniref:Uncharacterized protein n=1 Tax=Lacipirellula limnantheis TaxID=2528024 RepID=A0A517U052_9BACT|nr:hypothetical protein I41_32010 [Lacipirellula limnantheis]